MHDYDNTNMANTQDDERTVRDDKSEHVFTDKKDLEDVEKSAQGEVRTEDIAQEETADDFPEGGLRGWLCVLGASFGNIATFGYVNAWGIFQASYEQTLLSDKTPSTIAWIGSIQYALVFLPGLVIGRLFDIGYLHLPMALASAGLVVCTFLVAECRKYWQFLLCQGIGTGLFAGIVFGPLVGAVSHYFKRRRGLALGILAFGSATGGTLFPVAVKNLLREVGFKWTMRILAFILFFILTVMNLTVSRRLPPKAHAGKFFDWRAFKSPAYSVYCSTGFVSFLGLYTVLTYIDASAAFVGVDPSFSLYLVSIANAGSAVGRLSSGFMVDMWGPLNVITPFTFVAGCISFAWPFITSKGGNIALALVYGAASGVYASMLAAPIAVVGHTHDVGLRVGMFFTIVAVGALAGPPISGAINTSTGNYKAAGYYAGGTILCAVALLVVTRQLVLGRKLYGRA